MAFQRAFRANLQVSRFGLCKVVANQDLFTVVPLDHQIESEAIKRCFQNPFGIEKINCGAAIGLHESNRFAGFARSQRWGVSARDEVASGTISHGPLPWRNSLFVHPNIVPSSSDVAPPDVQYSLFTK